MLVRRARTTDIKMLRYFSQLVAISAALFFSIGLARADCTSEKQELMTIFKQAGSYSYSVNNHRESAFPVNGRRLVEEGHQQIEVIPGRAYHHRSYDGDHNLLEEVVILGDKGWNFKKGKWQELEQQQARRAQKDGEDMLSAIGTTECAGSHTYEGETYDVYVQGGIDTATTYLVDPKTHLLAHLEFSGYINGPFRDWATYHFDPTIKIEPPQLQP